VIRAFVTGGTGFVGANLAAGLTSKGYQVRVMRRAGSSTKALADVDCEHVVGDILGNVSELAAAMSGCDWVFHVAAVSDYWRQNSDWLYRVNVEGTRNVLEAARQLQVDRFIYCSSLAALLPPRGGRPVDEQNEFGLDPSDFPYAHSKHLAEREVIDAVRDGLSAVIVNPTVIVGPGDLNEVSGSLVVESKRGRMRFVFEGGMNIVAIDDVVAGLIAAAERGKIGERYIIAGANFTHWEAAKLIAGITGGPGPWLALPRATAPFLATLVSFARRIFGNLIPLDASQVKLGTMYLYANGDKSASEFNLESTPIESAVRSAYEWYRLNGHIK